MTRVIALVLLACSFAFAQEKPAPQPEPGMDHAVNAMSHRHLDRGPHMKLTVLREPHAGDQQRADAVLQAARNVMARYRDYRAAVADGYKIFLPNLPQKMYHFTNWWYGVEAAFRLNPDHPTSLLYEKTAKGYKLIGVMYTAPARVYEQELDTRIPLSVARWHEHTNLCMAPKGREREYFGPHAKFGLMGSITTEQECSAAGGRFRPQVFGWMVHVYPDEQSPDAIWSVERQMAHAH